MNRRSEFGRAVLLMGVVALAACGSRPTTTTAATGTSAQSSTDPSTSTTVIQPAASSSTAAQPATTAVPTRVVVGFGNSVPSGAACGCQNFVSAYAAMVANGTNTTMTVDNDAVSGSTSADVVNQLAKSSVQSQVRAASTVLIMTGANDFNDAFDQVSLGAPATEMYPPVATAVQENVSTIIDKIHALNPGAHVVVLDYWAAMEDGAVAAKDYDPTAMAASIACTSAVNDALSVAAKATGALYLSTYTAFKGPSGTNDPTGLLAADGDHPNAAGHQLIARTIYAALPTG
jgi:lysophospholipase L1-like esterase